MDWPSIDDLIRLIQSVSTTELAFVGFLAIVLAYVAVHVIKGREVPIWAKITVFIVVALLVFVGMLLVLGKGGDNRPRRESPARDDQTYYAYYEIGFDGGPTRDDGELRVFGGVDPQPDFDAIAVDTILITDSHKRLYRNPTSTLGTAEIIPGQRCLRVVAGQRVKGAPRRARSGGYFPVRKIECPAR